MDWISILQAVGFLCHFLFLRKMPRRDGRHRSHSVPLQHQFPAHQLSKPRGESYWDGYDPAGPDDQPFLAPMARSDLPGYRRGIDNMLAVYKQGIDFPGRVIQRCRYHGISPWITLRMNDCHYNDIPDHPFHGSFWKKNPRLQATALLGLA
ncbi:MAG: hypothetical protein ACLQNE_27985 [Thermoguttaceae bacterium]